jgi:hypothetical protein
MKPKDHSEDEGALEVMRAASRIFGDDRYGGGWLDRLLRPDGRVSLFVCAVHPTQDEIDELDRLAAERGLPLTVVSVKYSYPQLVDIYERMSGEELPSSCTQFGMDAAHNALTARLRAVDNEAVSFFEARVPPDALRIEIDPRAGSWHAATPTATNAASSS